MTCPSCGHDGLPPLVCERCGHRWYANPAPLDVEARGGYLPLGTFSTDPPPMGEVLPIKVRPKVDMDATPAPLDVALCDCGHGYPSYGIGKAKHLPECHYGIIADWLADHA